MRTLTVTIALMSGFILQVSGNASKGDTLTRSPKYDTAYILDYKDMLTMRIYSLIQDTRFVIIPDENYKITYKTNIPFKIGIGGFYKWFGLALAIGSPIHHKDQEKQGKSTSIDLRLNLYTSIFAIEGYLHSLKGFYTSNYTNTEGNHYTNPNLSVASIGANAYYIYNHKKFSLRAVYVQNEWQKKSAGSFIARIGFNASQMKADSGYIPKDWIRDQGIDSLINYTKGSLVSVSLAPGYCYNLVFLKRCYLHVGAFVGGQYNYLDASTWDVDDRYHSVSLLINLRGGIGYVGKKFHTGFTAILPGLQPLSSGSANFFWDAPQYRLWVGTRFDIFKKKNKKK